ncbi:MAG: ATP-binding protein [Candidatus Diapherotrites archaeon]|nr:ATP-binding protein [Candidatus Diapherotrites archaeon]
MSKEIATQLRGRILTYRIFPFSFKEFLTAHGIELKKNIEYGKGRFKVKKLFNEYLRFGGFPETVNKKEDIKIRMLQEYFDVLFYKDLVERYRIRNTRIIKDLMHYLTTNFGRLFSAHAYYKLLSSRDLKISKNTILEYLGYLEDVFYVFLVPKFSFSLKEQLVNPKKAYLSDNGFATAVAFQFSKNIGHFYENIVLVELKRRGKEVYYWKDNNECDFVIMERNKPVGAIQVCAELNERTENREIRGLLEALEATKLKQGLVITADKEKEETIKGKKIRFVPLWKWLLEEV